MATQKAIFFGNEDGNGYNLWVTDGTVAGTSELTAFAAVEESGSFLNNLTFRFIGGKALFVGSGGTAFDLWVTDGTAGGTKDLMVAGLGLDPADPIDITVLGSKALFVGQNSSGDSDLWVTDGTSAGTRELVVKGAYSGGVFAAHDFPSLHGGDIPDFTTLGGKLLFRGFDSNLRFGLFVTDGVSASELTDGGATPASVCSRQILQCLAAKRCSRAWMDTVILTFGRRMGLPPGRRS